MIIFIKNLPLLLDNNSLLKGAFSKARQKFKASAFTDLLHKTVAYFYSQVPQSQRQTWFGFRTLAIDRSDLTLLDEDVLAQEFGTQNNNSDVFVPMAKLSLLYNRGYYAYWLVLQHISLNLDFCFHLKSNACTQVKAFIQSGKKQTIITLSAKR